jgi:acid phosphatase
VSFPAIRLGVAIVALAVAGCATCEPQPNLGVLRNRLVHWEQTGAYKACFDSEAAKAHAWLRAVIAARRVAKPAVVLDIDETALSNWDFLRAHAMDIFSPAFPEWSATHGASVLPATLAIFNEARRAGVPVFFITGRAEAMRATTERELRAAGYSGWAAIHLKPDNYPHHSIIPFKSGVRRALEGQGYDIVLNMGDQWSDLEGGAARRTFKLPNPFYFVP